MKPKIAEIEGAIRRQSLSSTRSQGCSFSDLRTVHNLGEKNEIDYFDFGSVLLSVSMITLTAQRTETSYGPSISAIFSFFLWTRVLTPDT